MSIPEGCEVFQKLEKDGANTEGVWPTLSKNLDDTQTLQKLSAELNLDSLDAVELTMTAEECAACLNGSGSAQCTLGAFLIRATNQ